MQYAPDCVIVAPENARSRILEKVQSFCQRYRLDEDYLCLPTYQLPNTARLKFS